MCGAELKVLAEGVQRIATALQARGHPHDVFKLAPQDLATLSGAPVVDVTLPVPM